MKKGIRVGFCRSTEMKKMERTRREEIKRLGGRRRKKKGHLVRFVHKRMAVLSHKIC